MDDHAFDQKTALEWINIIEGGNSRARDADGDIYPRLKTWVARLSPPEILEIGSGQGICSDNIDLGDRRYTGLEPSPFLVDRAKHLYRSENRRFMVGNAYNMPFPNGVFDAAFSVAVWHLLSDLQKAANELSRVLRTGGHFLIITANPGAYSLWTDRYTDTRLDGRRFEGKAQLPDQSVSHDVLYLHPFDEIASSLQSAHLQIEEAETFRTSEQSKGREYFISIRGKKLVGEPENQ
jgi:SAM-dependent methyltransferase